MMLLGATLFLTGYALVLLSIDFGWPRWLFPRTQRELLAAILAGLSMIGVGQYLVLSAAIR
jgi:hypothetical protein